MSEPTLHDIHVIAERTLVKVEAMNDKLDAHIKNDDDEFKEINKRVDKVEARQWKFVAVLGTLATGAGASAEWVRDKLAGLL